MSNVLKDYAAAGAAVAQAYAAQGKRTPQRVTTGWVSPTDLYDRIDHLDQLMHLLDAAIQANVSRQEFKDAWAATLASWQAFRDKYRGSVFTHIATWTGVPFHTDEIQKEIEAKTDTYNSWLQAYALERDPKGQPLPPPPGAVRYDASAPTPPEAQGGGGSSFPWWGWVLVGVGTVGVGYLGYRMIKSQYDDTVSKKRALEAAIPSVLGAHAGPVGHTLGRAAVAHDPSPLVAGARDAHTQVPGDPDRYYLTGLSVHRRDLGELLKIASR